jgi:hypothetical protein
MNRLVFAAGLLMVLLRPGVGFAQTCPPEYPETRALVERFLTRPAHAQSRQETGVTSTSPSEIRLLLNGIDGGACTSLNTWVGSSTGQAGPWRWSYYTAGGRFFVALHYVDDPGTRRVGFVGLYVYDAAGRLLGTYAM